MKANKSMLALAVAGLFAVTASAFAHGPGFGPGPHGGGMGMMGGRGAALDPAQHAQWVQSRLDGLKGALKLQAGQVDAWNAYAAKVTAEAQARAQLRQGMLEHRGDAQAMADHRVTMMKHNAQAAEEINTLRKALVAKLSAEQKATFEQYAMGPRFARGPGADGAQPGYGPGYGPGRGGRGPGFGRGCIGAA